MRRSLTLLCLAGGLCALLGLTPAQAQLALPDAGGQSAAPAAPTDGATPAKPKAKAAPKVEPVKIDSVLGKPLKLNGSEGVLVLSKSGDAVSVDKLVLSGESTADAGAPCTIEVRGDTPMPLKAMGKIAGLQHYAIDFPACPIEFDLVDKAVLVPQQSTACVFQAAACQATPSGLWGPDAASLAGSEKDIAAKRRRADSALSAALKSLMKQNKGADADSISSDEEAFASARDEICRGYDGETTLGFCASRLTMARAATLAARLADAKHPDKQP
jgi:hypothetical protein